VLKENVSNLPLTEVKQLPSGFKGYPEGTKISYTPLTLGELEALNSSDMDFTRGIAMLLNSIHCNTVKVEDLYYWDVIYIGIQRKLLAFGDTRGVLYNQCPKCGNIVEHEFDYTEIDFHVLDVPDLPVCTKVNGIDVEFSLITIKDFLQINEERGELDLYARMIKNLPYQQAYELVKNCHGKDAKLIKYIDKQLGYGIQPFIIKCENIIEVENPDYDPKKRGSKKVLKESCNEEIAMEVRSPFEVVFPQDTDDLDNDFEIQFGKA
jgi:hypothetical protein